MTCLFIDIKFLSLSLSLSRVQRVILSCTDPRKPVRTIFYPCTTRTTTKQQRRELAVSDWILANVLLTARGHLMTIKFCHKQMRIWKLFLYVVSFIVKSEKSVPTQMYRWFFHTQCTAGSFHNQCTAGSFTPNVQLVLSAPN